MPESTTLEPPSAAAGFAELLASLTALKDSAHEAGHDAGGDELADDVATLSYESALRAHGRRRNPGSGPSGERFHSAPLTPESRSKERLLGRTAQDLQTKLELASNSSPDVPPPAPHQRKCASITVRMSHEECSQLRDRAAEAGLTVSAYLRSCAFEVETLRAQVKQTLAELRTAGHPTLPAQSSIRERHFWSSAWLKGMWSRTRRSKPESRDQHSIL